MSWSSSSVEVELKKTNKNDFQSFCYHFLNSKIYLPGSACATGPCATATGAWTATGAATTPWLITEEYDETAKKIELN